MLHPADSTLWNDGVHTFTVYIHQLDTLASKTRNNPVFCGSFPLLCSNDWPLLSLRDLTLAASAAAKSLPSVVSVCVTPETAAHQAPPSLEFSRQEHWSGSHSCTFLIFKRNLGDTQLILIHWLSEWIRLKFIYTPYVVVSLYISTCMNTTGDVLSTKNTDWKKTNKKKTTDRI